MRFRPFHYRHIALSQGASSYLGGNMGSRKAGP